MSETKNTTFCPIPWIFQAARNNGDIRICCQANVSPNRGIVRDEAGRAYNARHGRLSEARNAQLMKEVRRNMMNGCWSQECVRCQQEEASGLNSRRSYEQEQWPLHLEDVVPLTKFDGSIADEDFPIQYYDLRFGNRCNLACRMCGPSDSDSWYADHVALTGENHYRDSHGSVVLEQKGERWLDRNKSYAWYKSEKFWTSLSKHENGLKHIYMAGGEPLLIKEHYKFLERCIESGMSSRILLEYNTNLTLLPDNLLSLWKQFREVRIGASIDGYGETFEFQRYPGRWASVYENLKKLDRQEKPIHSWLAYTVTVYNVMHLPEFIRWKVEDSGFSRINSSRRRPTVTHHVAHKPEHLNVKVLSDHQKSIVSENFKKYRTYFIENFEPAHRDSGLSILDSVESYMNSSSYHEQFGPQLKQFSMKLDALRGQDSSQFLP